MARRQRRLRRLYQHHREHEDVIRENNQNKKTTDVRDPPREQTTAKDPKPKLDKNGQYKSHHYILFVQEERIDDFFEHFHSPRPQPSSTLLPSSTLFPSLLISHVSKKEKPRKKHGGLFIEKESLCSFCRHLALLLHCSNIAPLIRQISLLYISKR